MSGMVLEMEVRRLGEVVNRLVSAVSRIPVRGGGGGGGEGGIAVVSEFPAVPTSGGGRLIRFTGDGGLWEAGVGDTHWYPCSRFTDYEGTPGETA